MKKRAWSLGMATFKSVMHRINSNQAGFSYVEVLVSVVLLAILLVPALQALNTGILSNENNLLARQLNLRNKMEEVLSKTHLVLLTEAESTGNSTTSISAVFSDPNDGSVPDRRLVNLYRFDPVHNHHKTKPTKVGELHEEVIHVSVYYESEGTGSALVTLAGGWW